MSSRDLVYCDDVPKRHRSIEQLRKSTAWRRGLDLVLAIYRVTRDFPRDELFNLTFQLRKAAVRIPSCIAEGRERDTVADRRHFLTTARSSVAEIETQLVTSRLLGYLS